MLFLVAVACAAVAVSAQELNGARDSRLSQFLEGISVGMTLNIGNVTECTKDISVSLEHFDGALRGVQRGFQQKERATVAAALARLGKGFKEISHAFTVCGLFKVAEATDDLADRISAKSPFSVSDDLGISVDDASLTEDVNGAIKFWANNDVFQSGVYQGRMLNTMLASRSLSRRAVVVCKLRSGTRVTHTIAGVQEATFDDKAAQNSIAAFLNYDRFTCIGVSDVANSASGTNVVMKYVVRDAAVAGDSKVQAAKIVADGTIGGAFNANSVAVLSTFTYFA